MEALLLGCWKSQVQKELGVSNTTVAGTRKDGHGNSRHRVTVVVSIVVLLVVAVVVGLVIVLR